jgi:hypothetical protein
MPALVSHFTPWPGMNTLLKSRQGDSPRPWARHQKTGSERDETPHLRPLFPSRSLISDQEVFPDRIPVFVHVRMGDTDCFCHPERSVFELPMARLVGILFDFNLLA